MQKKMRVLVVDDEAPFARNLAKLLNGRGFETEAVFDGASAVAAVQKRPEGFEVVLLDIRMPDMDGIQALRQIKSQNRALEVIMLTGHASVETGVEAIRAGAFDYLIKPCDIEALVDKLMLVRQVEAIRKLPVLWPRTIAAEILLGAFVRLYPQDTLARAVEIFNLNRIRMAAETLFVVDHGDVLQGYLTPMDLVAAAVHFGKCGSEVTWDSLRDHPGWLPSQSVGQSVGTIMQKGGHVASSDMPLAALTKLMVENNLRSIPIIEQDQVIGVVRLKDALNHLQASVLLEAL